MSTMKKCQVVMLPTNEKAIIYTDRYGNLKLHSTESKLPIDSIGSNQHLYILSNDEIKKGDWCISIDKNSRLHKPFRCINNEAFINPEFLNSDGCKDIKKIIAATDKLIVDSDRGNSKLGTDLNQYLPQPSQSFIEKYVEEYNKGNIITNVLVKYEKKYGGTGFNVIGQIPTEKERLRGCYENGKQIIGEWKDIYTFRSCKVNPKDNTITIKKAKDSWNREEVQALIAKAWYWNSGVRNKTSLGNWIEENL